jgi:hypothetical protein
VSEGLGFTTDDDLSLLGNNLRVDLRSRLVHGSVVDRLAMGSHVVAGVAWLATKVALALEVSAHLLLEKDDDLLDQLNGVRAGEKVGIKRRSGELSLGQEVSTILSLGLLLLADLGELVVGNIELVAVDVLLVEVSTGLLGAIGALEANESASTELFVFLGLALADLDGLNDAKLAEKLTEVFLGVLVGNVLDEKVALLLGVLEALLLKQN